MVDLVEGVFTKGGLKEWSQWVEKEGEGSLKELGEFELLRFVRDQDWETSGTVERAHSRLKKSRERRWDEKGETGRNEETRVSSS